MASSANITHVRYFVPYDGDTEEHPNVFVVRKPMKGLTLADISSVSPSECRRSPFPSLTYAPRNAGVPPSRVLLIPR